MPPPITANLKLHLMADAGTFQTVGGAASVADGDPVGQWLDQSGGGLSLFNNTASQRLTLKTGANGQNGRAVLRGDGTDDFLTTNAQVASTATDNFTVFVASKIRSTVGFKFIFFNGGTGGVAFGTNGTNRSLINTGVAVLGDGAYVAGTFEIATYKRAAGTTTLAINGVNKALSNSTSTPNTPTATTVFTRSVGEYPDGDLGEVLLYDAALTAPQIADVEAYLNFRWMGGPDPNPAPPASQPAAGGNTKGRRRVAPHSSHLWAKESPWMQNLSAEEIEALRQHVDLTVPTAKIRLLTFAASVEVPSLSQDLRVPSAKVQARSASGFRLRIPENPNEKEVLKILGRLGLVPSDSSFEIDKP